ncbi:glycosyltransferase [Candidatus Hakubella thermalkaliphila]|uniref:Polyisoprenyl-phosphate glycosyltransferase n=1 Tax=Candidatus Hakubella thermalkaliphila TaxID=2754717 RepID=A0A6V8PB89_9ACTN|nr:glycosyltransferase [Candidatus Hakubella thermalkaliphila]GFP29955.1 polyisoprenyl-phosphate glycosyltransferase [Candidatus Hakubella thermalkaliphila]GFP38697.1 polyisoprenyl-phosphate glycosyltransferase [Candidatus Hakubella thermalkaliphila]
MVKSRKKFSILIPAFNEEQGIIPCVEETKKVFENQDMDYEIIIIDDGSHDDTFSVATDFYAHDERVIISRYSPNQGKGFALRHGFDLASGDLVVFMDADLDLHPEQIMTLYKYMVDNNANVVIGSKKHPESIVDYPWRRKILSSGYYFLVKLLFGLPVTDTQTGLKLFEYETLKVTMPKLLIKKFAFDLELLVNVHKRGFKIIETPVNLSSMRLWYRITLKDVYYVWMDTMAIFYRNYILRYYD